MRVLAKVEPEQPIEVKTVGSGTDRERILRQSIPVAIAIVVCLAGRWLALGRDRSRSRPVELGAKCNFLANRREQDGAPLAASSSLALHEMGGGR